MIQMKWEKECHLYLDSQQKLLGAILGRHPGFVV